MIAQNDQKVHTGIARGEMHEKCTKKMHTREVHARDAHAGEVREGSTRRIYSGLPCETGRAISTIKTD